jgi:hypothetical protein
VTNCKIQVLMYIEKLDVNRLRNSKSLVNASGSGTRNVGYN